MGNLRLRLVRRPDPNPELPQRFYLVISSTPDGICNMFRRYETVSQNLAKLWFERTLEHESEYQLRQMEAIA